jgi:hypothetical protein
MKKDGDKTIYGLADKLNFGKYKGIAVKELVEENPNYLLWCEENIAWFKLSTFARRDANKNKKETRHYSNSGYYDPSNWDTDIYGYSTWD